MEIKSANSKSRQIEEREDKAFYIFVSCILGGALLALFLVINVGFTFDLLSRAFH